MDYSQNEMDLAKRYIRGDLTEVQLNYLAFQNGLNKRKIRRLVRYVQSTEPFFIVVKLLIAFMMFHFFTCLLYSFYLNYYS